MIFLVNNPNPTLDEALNDPNYGNTRNTHSAKYKKPNSNNNLVHPANNQGFQHSVSQSSNHQKIAAKNHNNDKQKSDYWKDLLARLFAVLSFILIGAGVGLLVFGILKSKLNFNHTIFSNTNNIFYFI
jgi:hypothetical protein